MGGLNMQSMRSKRGAQEQGDLEVAHPTLSTTGARNLKGVKQSTTLVAPALSVALFRASVSGGRGTCRSSGPPIRWEMEVCRRVLASRRRFACRFRHLFEQLSWIAMCVKSLEKLDLGVFLVVDHDYDLKNRCFPGRFIFRKIARAAPDDARRTGS